MVYFCSRCIERTATLNSQRVALAHLDALAGSQRGTRTEVQRHGTSNGDARVDSHIARHVVRVTVSPRRCRACHGHIVRPRRRANNCESHKKCYSHKDVVNLHSLILF